MGTCYSTNTIKKTSSRRSGSCFPFESDDSKSQKTQHIPIHPPPDNNPKIKSIYNIYQKEDKLNSDINNIILKYNENMILEKINYIQLYNIFMNYTYDFTMSNLVLCDTREKTNERKQQFLKRFYQINYTVKQIQLMKPERVDKLRVYLQDKTIIFILKDESSVEALENYILYFISNGFDVNVIKEILILNEYIQEYNEENVTNSNLEYLYHFIDEDHLYNYSPKILVNCQDIRSSNINNNDANKNNALIFVSTYPHIMNSNNNKNDIINKFDINYICDKNLDESDIFLNFIGKFKITYIFNFILSNENYSNQNNFKFITHSEKNRKKLKGEEKKSLIKQKNITIPKNMTFEEFYGHIKQECICIIEEFKNQVIYNNCILIQFDDNIDTLFKYKLIYIIVFRITGLCVDDIYNYLKANFFDIKNNSFILSKKEEISNLIK